MSGRRKETRTKQETRRHTLPGQMLFRERKRYMQFMYMQFSFKVTVYSMTVQNLANDIMFFNFLHSC